MTRILLIITVLFITATSSAQEGVKVEGNRITMKEISPEWPGCENSELPSKECFNKQLNLHIKEQYKYPKDANGNLVRGKTTVAFTIDTTGAVTGVSAEGPQKLINEEVVRVVKAFPKMQPGMRAGKAIPVKFKMAFNL